MMQEVWPQFKASHLDTPQLNSHNLPCPYILSQKLLGTGSYANVYECKNTITRLHFAAKRFDKKHVYENKLMLQREFQVLKSILQDHPNILLMVDYFETTEYFYLVTDLAAGGELYERITSAPEGKLSVHETSKILSVLLSAIRHLHNNRIVHRDVKAENILFASRNSKISLLLLADFGQAVVLRPNEKVQTVEGTLSYLAPEVLSKVGHNFPVDLWAVGVLTYFMLCGYMPFDCDTDNETKELIAKADYVFEPDEYWSDIPTAAKDFISQCFKLDPAERITAGSALQHPFICVATPTLKPAFSSNSLQKLQEAVMKLEQSQTASSRLPRKSSPKNTFSRTTSSSNLPLRLRLSSAHLSSKRSFEDLKHALHGEKCHTPETVTSFTTPVTSTQVSRQTSLAGLDLIMKEFGLPKKLTPKAFSTGKVEFSI